MNLQRHLIAVGAALLCFLVMTILSASWGEPSLIAAGCVALACTAAFLQYRRKGRAVELEPVTPGRDDRVIPRDIRTAVIARDKGQCQLRYPGICLVDKQIDIDHIYPWSLGGSSKDMANLQCACHPCNAQKSNKVLV